jgi:uncharacterized membrane protein
VVRITRCAGGTVLATVVSMTSRALLCSALMMLASCTADMVPEPEGPDDLEPATSLAERACPEDSYLTWEDFGGPFMYTWCNGCHAAALPDGERQAAPLGVDFDNIDLVRHWGERIWARSADHNLTMPPIGGPDDVEREMLGEWLACGSPTLAMMEN